MTVQFTLNGEPVVAEIAPDERLSSTLRTLGMTSVKTGCEEGACGACTVWLNEGPILSCSTYTARCEGQCVTTLEGVQEAAAVLGEYIVAEGVDQCGFCAPGLMMLVLAMERELQDPGEAAIREYLNGNLCRCSGYHGKLRAIEKYLART